MFGIGFQELVLLSLIGLIVLGPERLPRVANQIGGWLGQARRMTRVMKRQLEDEINFEKDLNIRPPSREPSTQPAPLAPSADDHDSPADEVADPNAADGDAGIEEQEHATVTDADADADADAGADVALTTALGDADESLAQATAETTDADEPVTKEAS